MADTATNDINERLYRTGDRVRATIVANRNYSDRFHNYDLMIGVVMEDQAQLRGDIHVDWGGGYRGHRDTDGRHNGHCWYMQNTMITLMTEAMPMIAMAAANTVATMTTASPIPPIIPRLRVRISRSETGYGHPWVMTVENGPVPTKYEVRDMMDKEVVNRIGTRMWRNYNLNAIINKGVDTYGVAPEVFIAAISQAALAKQAREATGVFERSVYDSELQVAIGSQPAIIAIGDQVFTLQPRGVIKAGRAMGMIRERVVRSARVEAARLVTAAKVEARELIANGERQLTIARRQIEIDKAAVNSLLTMPQWISDNYIKVVRWNGSKFKMAFGIDISTKLVAWQMVRTRYLATDRRKLHRISETIRWDALTLAASNYHNITIWIPFDPANGTYSYQSGKIIEGNGNRYPYMLPHISYERCCMELEGMPAAITDMDRYAKLAIAMNRGNQEVNLMSLLSAASVWHPDIIAQMPPGVKYILDNEILHNEVIPDSCFVNAEIIPVETEASETFNVDELRENRINRGEALTGQVTFIGENGENENGDEHLAEVAIEDEAEVRELIDDVEEDVEEQGQYPNAV